MRFNKTLARNIVQNIIFWTISFFITLRLFSQTDDIRTIDIIYTFLFHIPFIVIVCLNIYHLIPNILSKYGFWIYLVLILIPGFGLTYFLYSFSFGYFASLIFPDYYFVALYSMLEILGIMSVYVLFSTLIELSKTWFNRKETELKFSKLEEENTKSELKALRAQINPHFLFNNLNTIYGEALKKSEKAPHMILKLSDILRYIVENMNKEEVALIDEVEYLEKYIELQKERLSNPNRVLFKTEGDFSNIKLPPLLLVNFIENCFKYGSTSELQDRILITLKYFDSVLTLTTSNSISTSMPLEKTSSGTGISNAEKRLSLLFPEKHNLSIKEANSRFELELKLDIK